MEAKVGTGRLGFQNMYQLLLRISRCRLRVLPASCKMKDFHAPHFRSQRLHVQCDHSAAEWSRRRLSSRALLLRLSLWCLLIVAVASCRSALAQSPPDKSGVRPSVISLPTGAGSIEGLGESFEPQLNTGGTSYGITITVVPGRASLTPSLRLGYDSYGGNGLAGLGWSLDLPSIKRQTDKGFPEYDSGDTLHPNSAGYEAMANAIDLNLFKP